MSDVTIRFLEVYEYLKGKDIVRSARDFALKIDITASSMNEILKKRSNPGVKPLQNIGLKRRELLFLKAFINRVFRI